MLHCNNLRPCYLALHNCSKRWNKRLGRRELNDGLATWPALAGVLSLWTDMRVGKEGVGKPAPASEQTVSA
jgi:hypothetical protein